MSERTSGSRPFLTMALAACSCHKTPEAHERERRAHIEAEKKKPKVNLHDIF